ncbi:MAG TPA: short-chain dehydrogenase/reductase [Solirubrobacteraceae bacterium]|nr:short-chain dehydrogenase/reductase [Solirubrobacteraceae bacterium]
MPIYDVGGKVALITGGARGIGFGIAQALYRRGASIALVDLDQAQVSAAAARLGDRAVGLAADVTDRAAIDAAVAATVERFGGIDIVVANAGIAPAPASIRLMPSEEFERVIEVNLLGVYRTVHAGLGQIVARQGQAVVVSSVYAFMNGILLSPYAVAKAGVEQLGRALRLELSPHGASATVAYFGFVDTEMVRQGMEQRQRQRGTDEELMPAFLRKRISPAQAGEAVAAGIEERKPRVIAPRWWAPPSVLRGVLNPLMDSAGEKSSRVHDEVRQAEAERGS